MIRFTLSPLARSDVESIWSYTVEHWDEDQAEAYVRSIQAGIEAVAAHPMRGPSCDELAAGYRRYRVGSHILFYRVSEGQVEIVRILHTSMDVDRHL